MGKKKQPRLRLVATDSKSKPQAGIPREVLGFWDPLKKTGTFKKERILHWRSVGATISDSAWNLLVHQGVFPGKKKPITIKKKRVQPKDEASAAPAAEPATA